MFCHNCGKQIPDGSKFCHYCGAAQEENRSASTSPPPVQKTVSTYNAQNRNSGRQTAGTSPKPKKTPIWVRILLIILAALLGRGIGQLMAGSWNSSSNDSGRSSNDTDSPWFSSAFSSSGTAGGTSYTSGSTGNTTYTPGSTGIADGLGSGIAYDSDSGTLGDCYLSIQTADYAVTNSGKPLLIVTYYFTNNSDGDCTFADKFNFRVYQDGVALLSTILTYEDIDAQMWNELSKKRGQMFQDVPPGKSLDVCDVYELNNTVSDVLVEVSQRAAVLSPGEEQNIVKKTFAFE